MVFQVLVSDSECIRHRLVAYGTFFVSSSEDLEGEESETKHLCV